MATESIRDYLSLNAEALSLREHRNMMLASNIANAGTPGYKARDIDFYKMLELKTRGGFDLRTQGARHFDLDGGLRGHVEYRQPQQSSMDGNTVELHVEQMQFSENVVRYHASLSFLNRRVRGLMTAIKGE
jgi:flagellar basal-body rod protein FlgB